MSLVRIVMYDNNNILMTREGSGGAGRKAQYVISLSVQPYVASVWVLKDRDATVA